MRIFVTTDGTRPAWYALTTFAMLMTLGMPETSRAADAELVAKLAPAIAQRCRAGLIGASDLADAVATNALPDLKPELTLLSGPRAISAQAFSDAPGPNRSAYTRLRRMIETWIDPSDRSAADYLPAEAGGVAIVERDGSPVLKGRGKEVLTSILEGDNSRFAFRCSVSIPSGETPKEQPATSGQGSKVTLSLARSPDDLLLGLSKKSFAEISYLRDEVSNDESFSIYATAGISWGEFTPIRRPPGKGGVLLRAIPSAFVQIEREGIGNGNGADEINNLNFGGQVSGFLQTRNQYTRSHYYAINAKILTDSDFKSRAWSAAFTITPEIPLFGNDQPYDIVADKLEFMWLLSGVADYFNVDKAGGKMEWLSAPEYARVGFDLFAKARFLLDESREQSISFIGDYRFREELGSGVGSARLLSLKLLFEPSERYALGFVYDRGRNLDTLEFMETWKITFGVKR